MPRPDVPGRTAPPLWLLVLITFSGTLAMHMFVPALPAAARDLGASPGTMQLTITLYLLGLAFGQLIYGPISDRYGRRPVLIGGLLIYTAAGLAAALAPGADALIGARLMQALGGCAGLALGRAMVRDTATADTAAKRMAMVNLMVSVGPGLAPLAGGALSETLGWRSIFLALGALGAVNLALVAWRLLETGHRMAGATAASLARDYLGLLRSPVFTGYAIGGSCATTALFGFLAAAPFVFVDQLHRSAHEVGVYLGLLVGGTSVGSILATRLIGRVPLERLLLGASLVGVLGAGLFLASVLAGALSVGLTMGSLLLFTVAVGVASPMALTKAISLNPNVVGSAAGLYGFSQMVIGGLCTVLSGIGSNPALAAGIVLAAATVCGQAAFRVALRREGRVRR